MTLEELRGNIDRIDSSILKLLAERMEKAVLLRRLKTGILDGKREVEVLARVKNQSLGLLKAGFTAELYGDIMNEAKRLQALDLKTVGFQGVHGANSEMACIEWRPEWVPIPCTDFAEVFNLVSLGLLDYGVLPVENTSGGVVGPVNTLLIHTELHVVGAIDMPISHCLMAIPGTDHRDIRAAYSHPQALMQCRDFLVRNHLEPRSHEDTAGAARMISEERPTAVAAIASRLAAELYGLEIIKEDIQDVDDNRTRFLVLSKEPQAAETVGTKCSIVFTPEHKAGSLFKALETFAGEGINLTRIESIPAKPGEFSVFIDFDGSDKDEKVSRAMNTIHAINPSIRMLGCYDEKRVI